MGVPWVAQPCVASKGSTLVGVLVFAGFAGEAMMTVPVSDWIGAGGSGGQPVSRLTRVTWISGLGVGLAPLLGLALAASAGRLWSGVTIPWRDLACRLALALIPLGAAMWAAHLTFHLLTSATALGPAVHRATGGLAGFLPGSGPGLHFQSETLLSLQTLLLGVGLLFSLHTGWRIACDLTPGTGRAVRLLAPWTLLILALYGLGLWSLLQPMPMRGLADIPLPP